MQRRKPSTLKLKIRRNCLKLTLMGYKPLRCLLITVALLVFTDPGDVPRGDPPHPPGVFDEVTKTTI